MQKVSSFLVTLLLFFLPFTIFPFGASIFEVPKVIAAEIAIEILLIIKIFDSKFSLKQFKRTTLLIIGLIITLSLSHIILFNNPNVFFGNIFRSQGVFLLWHLLVFALLSCSVNIKINPLIPLASITLLSASVLFFGNNLSSRAVGALGEPNALSATAVFLWPFLYFLKKPNFLPNILFKAITFLIPTVIILLSGSRSGLVAFLLQISFIVIAKINKISLQKTVCIIIGLLLITYTLPFIERGKMFENRSDIWKTAFVAGLESPLLGGGFGNTENLINKTSIKLDNYLRFKLIDSSHNIFLDWFLQGGLIGLISLAALIMLSINTFIKSGNLLNLTLVIGLLAVLSFNPSSITTLVAFWWIIGQGIIDKPSIIKIQ